MSKLHPTRTAESAGEMVDILVHHLGLPVTALSDILDVERKTIYDWWRRNAQAGAVTSERLRTVRDIFDGQPEGAARFYHRFWKRTLADGSSLREILLAESMDFERAQRAMNELWPAVKAAIASDRARGPASYDPPSAADLLSDYRVARASK